MDELLFETVFAFIKSGHGESPLQSKTNDQSHSYGATANQPQAFLLCIAIKTPKGKSGFPQSIKTGASECFRSKAPPCYVRATRASIEDFTNEQTTHPHLRGQGEDSL